MALLTPWILAARPRTLPAAASPVIVGGALAATDGSFRWDALAVTLFAALAIQVGVNLANDLSDALRGADAPDRVGPTRAVASGLVTPTAMRRAVAAVFAVASLAGLYLIALGGWPILVIGVASILAALGYTGGPWPYGYRGLGEAAVFVFFGLAATVGSRWVHDRSAPAGAWWAGVVMGLLAVAILVANNVRDLDTDRRADKRTLAVILGARRSRILYAATLGGAFTALVTAVAVGALPPGALVALVAAPLGVPLIRTLWREEGRPLVAVLVGTARLQLAVAVLLAAGILVGT